MVHDISMIVDMRQENLS